MLDCFWFWSNFDTSFKIVKPSTESEVCVCVKRKVFLIKILNVEWILKCLITFITITPRLYVQRLFLNVLCSGSNLIWIKDEHLPMYASKGWQYWYRIIMIFVLSFASLNARHKIHVVASLLILTWNRFCNLTSIIM